MFFERSANCQPDSTLPAGAKDVVVAVTFIKLWTFDRWVFLVTVENDHAIVEQLCALFFIRLTMRTLLIPERLLANALTK